MIIVARQCAWCGEYPTEADRKAAQSGIPTSHGICAKCEKKLTEKEGAK